MALLDKANQGVQGVDSEVVNDMSHFIHVEEEEESDEEEENKNCSVSDQGS